MTPATQLLLSGALTFGTPLALAIRDLFWLHRGGGSGGGDWRKDPPKPVSPPPSGGIALSPRPLPDCLIPKRNPNLSPAKPVRVKELA